MPSSTSKILDEEVAKIEEEETKGGEDTDDKDTGEEDKDTDEDKKEEEAGGDGGDDDGKDTKDDDEEEPDDDDEEDEEDEEDDDLEEEEEEEEEPEEDKKTEEEAKSELASFLDSVDDKWVPKTYKELLEKAGQAGLAAALDKAKEQQGEQSKLAEEEQKELAQIQKAWDTEIKDLIKEGELPKIKATKSSAKWDSDPGVKAQRKVFNFMTKENKRRDRAGVPKISSFRDAYLLSQAGSKKTDKKKDKKEDKEAEADNKRAGMVGGTSKPSGDKKPAGIRSGQTVYDILAEEMSE